jgi:hypothetical protein
VILEAVTHAIAKPIAPAQQNKGQGSRLPIGRRFNNLPCMQQRLAQSAVLNVLTYCNSCSIRRIAAEKCRFDTVGLGGLDGRGYSRFDCRVAGQIAGQAGFVETPLPPAATPRRVAGRKTA